jgi:cytidylate kinase
MPQNKTAGRLLVIDLDGRPRGGKGTIAKGFTSKYEGMAIEETGADYRTVTKKLLADRIIHPSMAGVQISNRVAHVDEGALQEIVDNRQEIVAAFERNEKDALYTGEVASTVQYVSRVASVRKAIKAGFTQRLMSAKASERISVVCTDGRRLSNLVREVDDVELVMSSFVTCSPLEVGLRECARQGVDINTVEGSKVFHAARTRAEERSFQDRIRSEDPVGPEANTLDYWALQSTAVGAIAAQTGRQVLLDTSMFRKESPEDPVAAMVQAADTMFTDALDVYGYRPVPILG